MGRRDRPEQREIQQGERVRQRLKTLRVDSQARKDNHPDGLRLFSRDVTLSTSRVHPSAWPPAAGASTQPCLRAGYDRLSVPARQVPASGRLRCLRELLEDAFAEGRQIVR